MRYQFSTLLVTFVSLVVSCFVVATADETKIMELAPGVYFRKAQTSPKFTGCNQGWIIFKDYVLVIEANFPGQVAEVVESIRKTTDKPIRFVFDTHYHGDHADGNIKYVELGATVIAHERSQPLFQNKGMPAFEKATSAPDRIKEYGGLRYGIPSMFFSHKLVFDDGDQRLELVFLGHAHTAGDAVAWLPKHQILFTGDACVNGAFNYTGDSNTESWIHVLSAMKDLGVKKLAPGHGELSDASLLDTQKRFFVELRSAIQQGIANGKTVDDLKSTIELPFYKEWTGVDVKTRTENIEHIYRELAAVKQPLEKSTLFRRWQSLPIVHYQDPKKWSEKSSEPADDYYQQLAGIYLKSDSALRRQIRDYFSNNTSHWESMRTYVCRMAMQIQTNNDFECMRRALAIAAIEGGQEDYRKTIQSLVMLRIGAERGGFPYNDVFQQIQQPDFIATENKPLFETVRTMPTDSVAGIVREIGPSAWN